MRIVLGALVLISVTAGTRYAAMVRHWPDRAPGPEANYDNYDRIAWRLYTHGEYGEYDEAQGYRYRARRAPGLPLLLGAVYRMSGGVRPWNGLLANVVFEVLTVLLLYGYALRATGRVSVAIIAGSVYALYVPAILLAPYLASEPMYTCFLLAGALLLMASLQESRKAWHIVWLSAAAGYAWGVASLTRPVLFYFPFLWLVAAGGMALRRRRPAWGGAAAILLVAFLAVHAPWAARNYRVLGAPVWTTTWSGCHLFQKNFVLGGYGTDHYLDVYPRSTPEYQRAVDILHAEVGKKRWAGLTEVERDAEYMRAVKNTVWSQKARFVAASLIGIPKLWLGTNFRSVPPFWTMARGLFSAVLLVGAGLGACHAARRSRWGMVVPVAIVLYCTALHAVSVPESRYIMPLVPLLLMLSAESFVGGRGPARKRKQSVVKS